MQKSSEDVIIALDASGIKVSNRGDWIRHKWKVRRGYLKIHVAVDVKRKKILALEVTDEKVGDGRMLQPLVEVASTRAKIARHQVTAHTTQRRTSAICQGKGY